MSKRILIVEDTKEISDMLSSFLSQNGYDITAVCDGDKASGIMRENSFDIILMDLMLPYKSGGELIKELRAYSDTPVIVISARSMMETRLEVLRIGADDYIIKPFDLNEVLVRIEVVMRRTGRNTADVPESRITICGITLDTAANTVLCNDKEIPLTSKEMGLLCLFFSEPKKVFTKANLYESVWNETYYYEDNTVNVHISNLRSKLKKAAGHDIIETVWGIGYRLREEKP